MKFGFVLPWGDARTAADLAATAGQVATLGNLSGGRVIRSFGLGGATWWIEADWSVERAHVRDYARDRLLAGPPR